MAAKTAENKPVNDMEIMEPVFVPKVSGEDDTLFVALNGRTYLVPRGKRVEVPKPVADIIHASEDARSAADAFAEAEQEKMKTVMGAP
jgi:hypothetical protein